MLLIFFCQIVEIVIAINAIIVAIKPNKGMSEPTSKPKTNVAPINPSKAPTHCFVLTSSPSIGPLRMFVNTGN